MTRTFALLLLVVACTPASVPPASAQKHAVILMYHHVADDTPRSTSVTPAAFEAHLEYLAEHDFNVIPLPELVDALRNGQSLPARSIALTFDDAYPSVYSEAWPQLRARGWHFTVFTSTDYIDRGFGNYMTWEQLRALADAGMTIANHGRTHTNLVRMRTGMSDAEWQEAVRDEVLGAQERLQAETGTDVRLLAYPYGESDPALQRLIASLDFVALGQQSGAVGPDSHFQDLARYPISTGFSGIEEFATRVHSRPLNVDVLEPETNLLGAEPVRPVLRLALKDDIAIATVNCFASGTGGIEIERDADEGVLVLRANNALPAGRSKYTCTAPVAGERGAFYWYSHLWIKPRSDGTWPPE